MAKTTILFLALCMLIGLPWLNNSSRNLNTQTNNKIRKYRTLNTQTHNLQHVTHKTINALNRLNTQTHNLQHVTHNPLKTHNSIVAIAQSQIGVKELTGNNDGKEVEAYLGYTNLPKGYSWCASFVSWVFGKAGFAQPRTPWSPALFPQHRLSSSIKPGFVYGLYDVRKKRIVHCGIATQKSSNWIMGIEGNTNNNGSVDGDGVYAKRRHLRTIHAIADWIR